MRASLILDFKISICENNLEITYTGVASAFNRDRYDLPASLLVPSNEPSPGRFPFSGAAAVSRRLPNDFERDIILG